MRLMNGTEVVMRWLRLVTKKCQTIGGMGDKPKIANQSHRYGTQNLNELLVRDNYFDIERCFH